MATLPRLADLLDVDPNELREELQQSRSKEMHRRRTVIGLSLLGVASMAAVSLLQTGIVRHLPDPPIEGFDSDKVNSSEEAYQFGVPDGTISLASLAANVPLAALGGTDRARNYPWVSLASAAKAAVEAVGASWYFYQMPTKEKAWCGYCIVGVLANLGILAVTLPEAREAMDTLRERR